jgi:hypothetical protein
MKMTRMRSRISAAILSLVSMFVLVSVVLADGADDRSRGNANGSKGVIPPNAQVLGRSYGDWGAEW